jgi:rare lipoprotein A
VHARSYGRPVTRALSVLACALALPSAAVAASESGGSGLTGSRTSGAGSARTASTRPAGEPVTMSSDGITLQTKSTALLRHGLSFTGSARGAADQRIEIERSGRATHGRWEPTVSATVASDGTFAAIWHTTQVGRFSIRAVKLTGAPIAHAAATAPLGGRLTVSVYRAERATIYGPGFYGRRTACGTRLTRATLGVANRRLPCGTEVSLMYRGRELTVPVIDRGPYANHASWDVTAAAANALRMTGTAWIGSIALPMRARPAPALLAHPLR